MSKPKNIYILIDMAIWDTNLVVVKVKIVELRPNLVVYYFLG